ncbi:uncharacterized protein LOC122082043 [Macadamia integrifolia]|uniref:uncharacterized protein LOC122082043 n=1 Tax=Macadamia integrifolia TaxID=60698 RepID=UPI001C4EC3A1|nr:uncharacterized protein LOC122082043 [Macadamia integrifolia]
MAVWELDPDSFPSSDRFSSAFFKRCWQIMEREMCNVVRYFFSLSYMPSGVNNNFMVLIPKVDGADTLDKFRPLCMGSFFCKIILKQVLRRFGFSKKWITSLHQLMVSTRISILINGDPQGYFGVERGLRQGDPISPMPFIIAEEVLTRGLKRLIQTNNLKTIHGPKGVPTPGHIFFANAIFIFSNASLRYVRNLRDFLCKYQEFSGQSINFEKNKFFLGKIASTRKQTFAETLGIPICNFPTRYLGVEIFKGRVKKEALMPIMDRVKGRLAGWKGKLLSMAERVELVCSVISGILNHNFAVYWWLSSLLATMERWMRNFIWSGEVDIAKTITVKWDTLCKPKEEGGLGIRRLRDTNKALLGKLVWRMKHERSAACAFLRARFVKKEGLFNKGCRHSSIAM